jgi:hypothetical protein
VDCQVNDANGNNSLSDLVDHTHCPIQAGINGVVQASRRT